MSIQNQPIRLLWVHQNFCTSLFCPPHALNVPWATYLFRFHCFLSSQLPPATQITQHSLCDTPFSMIYPQANFIWSDLFKSFKQCAKSHEQKKREKQGEQTKSVSVTKIPAIEKNGIPVDCLHRPTPASLCINTSSTLWESQLPLVDPSLSKFCRYPTVFHHPNSPSNNREGLLTSKVNANWNSKQQSARFLLAFDR